MKFDWKYGFINNFILVLLSVIIWITQSFSKITNFRPYPWLLAGGAIIFLALYFLLWERPFKRKHPEYKANNRQFSSWGWVTIFTGVLLLLLLIGTLHLHGFPLLWIMLLILFLRDSLSSVRIRK
ncbi:hypothetical protein FC81_GL001114 [Liquorilactobacillus capillatus DSM 19910]|uniref:Uncharacterized protein n=1 Tax=Liquorilactobacillus capillatus DSM 19910 TaxID=1423731 RepID=A0A0R1M7U8_9LACO|nr:hypothetical protein FC81_GL001114 [Liquorilactobacillus capillatus DSM 19910]